MEDLLRRITWTFKTQEITKYFRSAVAAQSNNFKANDKIQDEIDELTGVYFIPALLKLDGALSFDGEIRKLPWFLREFLPPYS